MAVENKTEFEKDLDMREARFVKRMRRSLEYYPERRLLNKILVEREALEREEEVLAIKSNEILKNNGYSQEIMKINDRQMEIFDRLRDLREISSEVTERIKAEVDKFSSKDNLEGMDKLLVETYKDVPLHLNKIYSGILKKDSDLLTGRLGLVFKVCQGDDGAMKQLLGELKKFISQQVRFYCWRLKTTKTEDARAFIESEIFKAARQWEKNKYFSVMEWIRGRVRTVVKETISEEYQKNQGETAIVFEEQVVARNEVGVFNEDDQEFGEQEPDSDDYGYSNEEDKEIKYKKRLSKKVVKHDDKIWIKQAARRIGVSAETLRNWDKNNIFRARKVIKPKRVICPITQRPIINEVKYRYYLEQDIPKLILIKHENAKRQKHLLKDKNTWRTKDVINHLNKFSSSKVSAKRLYRMEKRGDLPKPKRDEYGKYYFLTDIKQMAEIMKIEIKKSKDFEIKKPRSFHSYYKKTLLRDL